MNYNKIYNNIIERGLNRTLNEDVYIERHHILPKCMGGDDDSINIVQLTLREHFICHWLLYKMNSEHKGLLRAFNYMAFGTWKIKIFESRIPSSRTLEEKKFRFFDYLKTEECQNKMKETRIKNSSNTCKKTPKTNKQKRLPHWQELEDASKKYQDSLKF